MTISQVSTSVNPMTRQQLAAFLPNPRAVQTFEAIQGDATALTNSVNNVIDQINAVTSAPIAVTTASDALPNSSVITGSSDIAIALAPETATFSLTATGVTANTYGDGAHTVGLTVDAKGRVRGISAFALNSDNVTEGTTNLYFTTSRARTSISGIAPIVYNSSNGQISLSASGVTPGTYTFGTRTVAVDGYGRITSIS